MEALYALLLQTTIHSIHLGYADLVQRPTKDVTERQLVIDDNNSPKDLSRAREDIAMLDRIVLFVSVTRTNQGSEDLQDLK